jgi:hypothetical protein
MSSVNLDSQDGHKNPHKEEKFNKFPGLKIGMFYLEAWRLLLELEGPLHRVGTRQNAKLFSPVVGIGTTPTPHPQASKPPPPRFWGEGHTRWRERGWDLGESQFRRGDIHCGTLYIYVLCGPL